jgi:hypothetical protein
MPLADVRCTSRSVVACQAGSACNPLIAAPSCCLSYSALQRLPERILEKCVKGMLPKGRIASPLFQHLKVYKGSSHPHEAQRPLDITSRISKKPSEAL